MEETGLSNLDENVNLIREWIVNNNKFKGRTDDEFIMMFLHGCKYNLDKTKIKMTKYYENKVRYPDWWANRDPMDEQTLTVSRSHILTILSPKGPEEQLIAISYIQRLGSDPSLFHTIMKYLSMMTDILIINQRCYQTGIIAIIDCKSIPSWFILKMISPRLVKDFTNSFYIAIPIRFHAIHFINSNMAIMAFWSIFQILLPVKMRRRIKFYGSNWRASLSDHVPVERLPEELGGNDGPLERYSEETVNQLLNRRDFFIEDQNHE